MFAARPMFFAAALALAAGALAPQSAAARTNFDGSWSVLIQTNSGQCDRGYRYGLTIRDGQVFYEGSASVNVDGQVNRKGAVRVRLWAGSQSANGTGRLSAFLPCWQDGSPDPSENRGY